MDTPEKRTKDICEKQKAKQAQRAVAVVLKNAKRIDLETYLGESTFASWADIKFDGQSLSKFLLAQGLAYQYDGGKKRKVNWCK